MHGLSTGIQKTVNVTKNALESQDDSRVLNEQGTQRQLLDDQRTSYDEWEANTHVDGESGYWVDTVYYTDDRTTTKEEDYDLEKVPERLAKTDEEYLEKDHYLEHSLYGGEHHYEERHHQIIHHKPINEDEEDHYEHHYQWRSGTHDTSGETEEYLHKEALRQTTFDGYEEGIDHENHVDRYEDPWLDSHEGEGGVHVHLSTHSNDITETSEHHNQHYASSGEQHTGHDVIYANNLEDFNYDDINSGSDTHKVSSHDKESSAYKKSSHDKGSSAPKKSSHDKGSSAPKKSSHDKGSSAPKKSSHDKESSASKKSGKSKKDSSDSKDKSTGSSKDEHAVCSLSVSGSKSVCCKEGNKPCKSDKDCCRGQCLYKEDVFGNELKNHGKVCTEDQTCSAQRKKTTKDRCKTDSECCGFAQGHQQCLNDHCCRTVDSECNDDKSCCSGICKDHHCEDKPCIPLSQPCIPGTEQASCCHAMVLYDQEERRVPVSCAIVYLSTDTQPECCITDGNYCSSSDQCCSDHECIPQLDTAGNVDTTQPMICGILPPPPCKTLGDYCDSTTTCCKLISEDFSTDPIELECASVVDSTLELITQTDLETSGLQEQPISSPKCCIPELKQCSEDQDCCGVSKCSYIHRKLDKGYQLPQKTCYSGKTDSCGKLGQECSKSDECCLIPVSTNDDLFYAQAKCQGPKLTFMEGKTLISSPEYSKGKSGGKKSANEKKLSDKKCCLENGSPCSSNDQCCVGYTCRDINGRRMCTPPSCSSIGEDCSETQNCCQLHEHILDTPVCKTPFQQLTLFTETSIKKSGALAVSSLSYFAPLSFCCVPEGQICLRNSDCCDPDASCGHPLQSKTELWAPGEEPRRCFTNRCRFTKEYCQFNSDCCEEDTICSTYSETSLEGTKKKCCKVKGSDCTSSEDCCLGKCYQEEDQYGVLLINTGQKCLDSTCQESGQVPTGAQCSHASDCCGYEKGAHDCRAGYCCRPVGQSCHSGVDCCTEFCDHGVCSEKHCMYAGQPCTPDSYTEECCSTSVWTMDGDLEIPSSCGLAHSSVVWNGNHVVALHERTACCFEEGAVCNSDAQCCSGTHCVYENNQFGTTYINTLKRCLKNTCTALGKIASGEYCHSKDECCGSEIVKSIFTDLSKKVFQGLQDCVDGMCCRIDGFECEADSQCCGRSTCQADEWGHRTCQMPPCASLGRSCDQDFTCCLVTNQDREVEPHCYHDSSMNSMCCYPEGFDCTNDLECCPGSKCVIPTNHHGVLIFGGGPDKQTKCVTERCMLGYAKPPGHECSSTDECCGFEAGIQECRGACCIKDNEQCKHSHHCCNGFCDPRSKRCVDPSCRLLGHKCIPALEHSCCKTIIHETIGDFGDEFTRVFPDNTHKRYQNMHSEKLPSAALVKKEKHDGSWDLHYSPVAIEVVPVCRLNEDFFHTDPKCCIEYGLRCQRSRDCCQYQDGDTVDCVYQKDPFGVEVHELMVSARQTQTVVDPVTMEKMVKLCKSATLVDAAEQIQINVIKTVNAALDTVTCLIQFVEIRLVFTLIRTVHNFIQFLKSVAKLNSLRFTAKLIASQVDVFAAYNSDHLVDLVTPTCSRRPPMGYSCCMTEGQKCNVQSDCCRGPGSHSMHPEDDGIFPTDLICETAKDEFGVAQYGASKEDVFGVVLADDAMKCTSNKCAIHQLAPPNAPCLRDQDCCQTTNIQQCNADYRCCIIEDEQCAYHEQCCTKHCNPEVGICTQPPCRGLGEDCSAYSLNPQICCPLKILNDQSWGTPSLPHGLGEDRTLVQPSCQPLDSSFRLGCCLSLHSPCLTDSDCCQFNNRQVSCMLETDYFGIPIHNLDQPKRCLIKNEYCSQRKNGDLCSRDEDCCANDNEDGALQRCGIVGQTGQSRCCKIQDQECRLDQECCTGHCDLWTHTCKIATCTKLGEECSAEPTCCPVPGRNDGNLIEPVCRVMGLSEEYLADANLNEYHSTYWKQCCVQIGDYCRVGMDCCGYQQRLSECSKETSVCVMTTNVYV
eukprot:g1486.t1